MDAQMKEESSKFRNSTKFMIFMIFLLSFLLLKISAILFIVFNILLALIVCLASFIKSENKKSNEQKFNPPPNPVKKIEISPVEAGPVKHKEKIAAALFALLFGGLGVHKFYLGYKREGILMLSVSIIGIFLVLIPTLVIGLVAFAEFIIYITKSDEEFRRVYVENKRPWF